LCKYEGAMSQGPHEAVANTPRIIGAELHQNSPPNNVLATASPSQSEPNLCSRHVNPCRAQVTHTTHHQNDQNGLESPSPRFLDAHLPHGQTGFLAVVEERQCTALTTLGKISDPLLPMLA